MVDYSALPMDAYAWADPDIDLENPRFVISVEWTWPQGDWTHFSLVRSTRSPVRRREEGQVMMVTAGRNWDQFAYQTTGLPVYRDPQPPPGEWTYYTAFVLDPNRIWQYAGEVFEVSIADYDWALQLPELLPGVAIADTTRTASPAEQSNLLVQFLQNPGALLDKVVTMAEAAQFFWDPLRVPPQMLRAMGESMGYEYDEALGIGRVRHVLEALMGPRQGTLPVIRDFAIGATGCDVRAEISNNLMLDTNDSSFENGTLVHPITGEPTTKWLPLANLELRKYENWPDDEPMLHPNVLAEWFLYLKATGTYTCGPNYTITTAANPAIAQQGVPIAEWKKVRMGVHAYKPNATVVYLSMGMKLYDSVGRYLRDLRLMEPQQITTEWAWYPSLEVGTDLVPEPLTDPVWQVDAATIGTTTAPNLLTANQASIETNTTGFTGNAFINITRNTAYAADGTASLAMTCNSSNMNMMLSTLTGLSGVPVTAGDTYTATVSIRAGNAADSTRLDIQWYDAAGAGTTSASGSTIQDTTGDWTVLTTSGVAPAAGFAAVVVNVYSAPMGHVHYVDKLGLWKGNGGTWGLTSATIPNRLLDLTGGGKDLTFGAGGAAPMILPYNEDPYLSVPTGLDNTNNLAGITPNIPGIATMTWDIETTSGTGFGFALINQPAILGALSVQFSTSGQFIITTWTGAGPVAQTLTWNNVLAPNTRKTYTVNLTTTGAELLINGSSQGTKTFGAPRVPATNTSSSLLMSLSPSYPTYFRVYSFDLYGALVFDPVNVMDSTHAQVVNMGTQGGVWSFTRPASSVPKVTIVDRPILQFVGSQWAQTANFPASLPVGSFLMVLRHHTSTSINWLARTEVAAVNGFQVQIAANTNNFVTKVGSGSLTITAPNQGARVIGLTYDGTTLHQYQDGVHQSQTAGSGSFLKDLLLIGGSVTNSSVIDFVSAALWDRVLTEDEMASATRGLTGGKSLLPSAYAVPWITVSNPCSVDLIVVDDG